MLLLLALAREVTVMTLLLYSGARVVGDKVRLREWEHAVRAAFVYVGVSYVVWRVALVLAILPLAILAKVPFVGVLMILVGALAGSFALTCASLWVTQWVLGGEFELEEPAGVVALGGWIWLAKTALALAG